MNHLHQRKPAQRAFSGLVGRYEPQPAEPASPDPTGPTPIAAPRQPGPARTYASNAERQRAYRSRKSDPERRDLIASILKKSRSSKPSAQYVKNLHSELLTATLPTLRKVLATLNRHTDSHGRLHNERSGEGPVMKGQSEIERLVARQQQSKKGHQVTAKSPSILRAPQSDEMRNAVIRTLLEQISVDHKCPWCDAIFEVPQSAENHFIDLYAQGKKQAEYVATLKALILMPTDLLADAERKLKEHIHYLEINKRVSRLRKHHAKWQRRGKQILDASRTYVGWDTRTWANP